MGFFAGLGAALGGAAQPLRDYNTHVMDMWQKSRDHLSQLITDARDQSVGDPQRYAALTGLVAKMQTAKPGADQSKIVQQFQELTQVHPSNIDLMHQAGVPGMKDQQAAPGTPQPVQTIANPGPHGALAGLIAPQPSNPAMPQPAPPPPPQSPAIQHITSLSQQQPSGPPSAQPAGNPIQGGAPIQLPPSPAPAPAIQPMPAQSAAPMSEQPPLGISIPGMQEPMSEQDILQKVFGKELESGFISPASRAMKQPLLDSMIAHNENLRQQKAVAINTLAIKRAGIQHLKDSGSFAKMSPLQQQILEAEGEGLALSMPGQMMTPHTISTGTLGSQAPDDAEVYGRPGELVKDNPNTRYRVVQMNGQTHWVPEEAQIGTAVGSDGKTTRYNKQSGENLGGVAGTITPSLLPTSSSKDTVVQGPNGPSIIRTGSTSSKVLPKIVPGPGPGVTAGAPAPLSRTTGKGTGIASAPASPSSGGTHGPKPLFTADNKDADYWAQQLQQPALSTTEANNIWAKISANKPLTEAVRSKLAGTGADIRTFDSSVADQAKFANQLNTHLKNVDSTIDNLDKAGKLGPILSRWNDFMSGKVGAGDKDFTALRTKIGLIETALGRVHGGARGGASPHMLEHFKGMINAGTMDANTLKSSLGEIKEWVDTYSNPKQSTGPGAGIKPMAGGTQTFKVGGKTYNVPDSEVAEFKKDMGLQ